MMKIIKSIEYDPALIKGGYTDEILQIDLGSNAISLLKIPPDFKEKNFP